MSADIQKDLFIEDQLIKKAVKDYLDTKSYYIYYYRVISPTEKTKEEISKELNISIDNLLKQEEEIKNKLKDIYQRLINKTTNKYTKRQLLKMDLKPISPKEIAYFNYLQKELDELTYFVLYTKKFNKDLDNINYYKKKISYLSEEKINELILSVDNLEYLFDEELILKVYKKYLKDYTVSQIFELDIKHNVSTNYQQIINFFDNYTLEDIQKEEYYQSLDEQTKEQIDRYFRIPKYDYRYIRPFEDIERDINLYLMGYYNQRELQLKKSDIEKILEEHSEKFSDEAIDIIKFLFLNENNIASKEEKNKKRKHYYFYRNKLLRMKYHINDFFANDLYVEQIMDVINDSPGYLTDEEINILLRHYKDKERLIDMAAEYNEDYPKFHGRVRNLRRKVLNKYFGLGYKEKDISEDEFIKYLLDPRYDFSDESRRILKMYFIEHLSYKEIANMTEYTQTQVSNFVTEGIRKLNFYYYGILTPIIIDKKEFEEFLSTQNIVSEAKEMVCEKYIDNKEMKQIAIEHDQDYAYLSKFVERIYREFLITKVGEIPYQQYEYEVNCHFTESVLTEDERELVALKEGIKSKYNPTGKIYPPGEIYDILDVSSSAYGGRKRFIDIKIREKMLGFRKPEYGIIPRKELENILKDNNLPLSEKERDILNHLNELNGCDYLTDKELAKKYNMSVSSLKRRYQRAILSILQYQNNKKSSQISYENDIKPILKYFSSYDINLLKMFYKDKLSVLKISKKLDIKLAHAQDIVDKLQVTVAEILHDYKSAKKFDFEYARKVMDDDDFPIFDSSNKDLYIKVFRMLTGEGEDRKYSGVEIKNILDLDVDPALINSILYHVMLACEKHKLGIRSNEIYNREQIEEYYNLHKDTMRKEDLIVFVRYLNKRKKISDYISVKILYRMLKDEEKLIFNLEEHDINEIKKYLFDKNIKIPNSTKKKIQLCYEIPERELLTGKEKNKILKLLEPIYLQKTQELDNNQLKKI